jgi:hypothetical protein
MEKLFVNDMIEGTLTLWRRIYLTLGYLGMAVTYPVRNARRLAGWQRS